MMLGLPPRLRRPGIRANWDLGDDEAIDQYIEARVAERARREAVRWRFRLVLIETAMMATLVAAAGLALGQKAEMVLRGAALVGAGCLVTGGLLIGLSAAGSRILSSIRLRRKRDTARRGHFTSPEPQAASRFWRDAASANHRNVGKADRGALSSDERPTPVDRVFMICNLLHFAAPFFAILADIDARKALGALAALSTVSIVTLGWLALGEHRRRSGKDREALR